MTGPLFMRPYSGPHFAHIIKQADEARSGTPIPVTDDSELFASLRPSTIYTVRIVLWFSGGSPTGWVWRPACTNAVDFSALAYHRPVGDTGADFWVAPAAADHQGHLLDTTAFNAGSTFNAGQNGARRCTGMIKTSSSGGTFSVMWGGSNVAHTLTAGSFMYLQEAEAY